jgi:hypothetical protein
MLAYLIPALLAAVCLANIGYCIWKAARLTQFCFWVFVFYFFVVAPTVQISSGSYPWGWNPYREHVFEAQLLILCFCLMYQVGDLVGSSENPHRSVLCRVSVRERVYMPREAIAVLSVGLATYLAFILSIGLEVRGLFTSREEFRVLLEAVASSDGAGPFVLIILALVRVPTVIFVFYGLYLLEQRLSFGAIARITPTQMCFLVAVIVISILPNSPLVASRFWAGALLTGCLFWLSAMSGRYALRVAMVFFLSVVVVAFTFANMFRREGESVQLGMPDFSSGHYDAFVQVINAVQIVQSESVDYGRQMIGALLYWVPRSIWADKPVGTGHFIHEYLGYPFTNVSAPLIAETYIAFGFAGVIVAGVLTGFGSARLEWIRAGGALAARSTYLYIFSWFFLAYQWILMRGDLMTFVRYLLPFFLFVVAFDRVVQFFAAHRLRILRAVAGTRVE